MFNNIGQKIQTVAKVLTCIGIIMSVIGGLTLFGFACNDPDKLKGLFFLAPAVTVIGSVASWLSNIVLYGFGKLIEDTQTNRNQLVLIIRQLPNIRPEQSPTSETKAAPTQAPSMLQGSISSLNEAISFLNQYYNIQIDLSDNTATLKEKISKIESGDSEIFKNRIANATSIDEIFSIIRMHHVILNK